MSLDATVYAYDLCTNVLISSLAATNLTYAEQMNDSGSISFTLALSDPATSLINQTILGYQGAPFKVIVDNAGVILFSGIAWTTAYDDSAKTLEIGGKGLLSYFDSRTIAADYSAVTYPAGLSQATLVQKAIADCQAVGNPANIGVQTATILRTTPLVTIPAYAFTQYPTVGQILSDVTTAVTPGTGGVDITIRDSYSGAGAPVHTAVIETPRCGRAAGFTGLLVDLSRVISWTWPTDSSQSANQVIAVGAGTGTYQPVSVQSSGIAIGGLGQPPLLQAVLSYNAITSAAALNATARGAAAQLGQASIATPTVTIPVDYGPAPLGSYVIGDDIRVLCPAGHVRFPNGLDQFWRIVQIAVTVADEGVSTVTLTLNPPPIF